MSTVLCDSLNLHSGTIGDWEPFSRSGGRNPELADKDKDAINAQGSPP
jgi:hypothetical protein